LRRTPKSVNVREPIRASGGNHVHGALHHRHAHDRIADALEQFDRDAAGWNEPRPDVVLPGTRPLAARIGSGKRNLVVQNRKSAPRRCHAFVYQKERRATFSYTRT
jgi:hypothetical protein